MRHPKKTLWFVVIGIVVGLGLAWLVKTAVSNRVVASARTSDGVEFAIVQEFNWTLGEMFTTSAVYFVPGASWEALNFDHEDTLWLQGTILMDESNKTLSVLRQGRKAATFQWDDRVFTRYQSDKPVQVSTNGAVVLPKDWELGMRVWRRQ